jgi:hypothetical protein
MNKRSLDKLILKSYKNNYLDERNVKKIAALLSKQDLKKYINGLKLEEMKKSVIISSPNDIQDRKKFEKLFPHKKIVFSTDKSLMLGIRIVDNDIVHEFSLRNSLDKILNYVGHSYD